MKLNKIKSKLLLSTAICMLLLLFGCSPRLIKSNSKESQKDSIYYSVNYIKQDTFITIEPDTLQIKVPYYELQNTPLIKTSNKGVLTLKNQNDTIIATCEISELKHKITLLHKEIKDLRFQTKQHSETNEIPVKYIPNWVKAFAGFGVFFFTYLLMMLYNNLKPKK